MLFLVKLIEISEMIRVKSFQRKLLFISQSIGSDAISVNIISARHAKLLLITPV